jgi:hypothetical protein
MVPKKTGLSRENIQTYKTEGLLINFHGKRYRHFVINTLD